MYKQKYFAKFISVLCFTCITSFSYASENDETIPRIIPAPAEPLDVVLLCPEGSQHEGELVPKWVANDEAMEFFCNDADDVTEVAE